MEDQKKKKKYEKPEVTRITLDAKCAVLGSCKNYPSSGTGPAVATCSDDFSSYCYTPGS
jgi:hypothetical protein